jgi:acetylornithine/LysW-gamma-L-lysine aminotransferase
MKLEQWLPVNEKEIIDAENRLMANVFAKKPVVLTRGKGALVWDVNGKEYVDCNSSYGVALFGHCHPRIVEALCKQAEQLISCHAGYYNDKRSEFLQKLTSITPKGLNKAFLSNSGAESVECALKLARKYAGKPEIIAVMGAFHGKTMGALSATWDKKYREPFLPLVPEIKHVPPDNLEKAREAVGEKTAAILVEPIRGEGGVRVPPDGYLKGLRELCDEKNILLMFDEVQTGLGRTGKLFACEHWGVVPDVMCLAKPLAGGLPLGATVAREDVMSAFKVGDHSTTYSGNPLVCAAGCAAIDVLVEEKLAERAAMLGVYFKSNLEKLQSKHKSVKEVRGLGLMLGMETKFDGLNVILKAMDKGVLVLDAGRNVLRFLPPLVISKEQIDKALSVLDSVLEEEENARTSGASAN